jgi:transitional endoplasmic reticulum ATPase
MMKKNYLELRVGEIPSTLQGDVGRGIVRIDSMSMSYLNVKPGDVVEIEGKRKTPAIVKRAFPSDVGVKIIRMDGLTRRNANTSIGEIVLVRKSQYSEGRKVVLAPAQKGIMVQIPNESVARTLIGRAIYKGDIIEIRSLTPRRRGSAPLDEFISYVQEDMGLTNMFGFGEAKFVVVSTNPPGVVRITERTEIELLREAVEVEEERIPEVTYEDIGGITEEVKKVREMIELPLKHPELFERLGIAPPKGVLLHGPPGSGKTLLAKAVANETTANFIAINGPEIMSKYVGEAEKRLRNVFQEAEKNAPSIIFIDEIDAIAPKREEVYGGVEGRVVAQLLALMDGLKSRGQVIVIAATNRPNALDPALRRVGRFDREIEIGVPDQSGRKEILQIHTRNMPLNKDVDLKELAESTHGFVGSDIEGLCKEAAMCSLRRLLPELNLEEDRKVPRELLEKLVVTRRDFLEALKVVRPSALREVLVEVPKVRWSDIGGLEDVKQALKEAVEWPLKHKDAFKRLGIRPPKGVLLYGAPGTGKTLLAKAVATESEANFISVKGPEVISKWVGESEKAIREIFRKARQVAPCVVFFDELDSIASRRGMELGSKVTERVVNQLLTEMDGLELLQNVVVVAATNRPDILDLGLLRPGRFDRHILVPTPDKKTRLGIFKVHVRDMPLDKDVNLEELVEDTEDYVGADIEAVCREAAMLSLREDINAKIVKKSHFEQALKKVGPSLTKYVKDFYAKIEQVFKEGLVKKEKEEAMTYYR